mmetsp:Transcript_35533/g.86356  ORF Transcript_35533/g.86356 Transcript_35533/m.86356 type:complete len:264 (+) Transcript_35533:67-858(+)
MLAGRVFALTALFSAPTRPHRRGDAVCGQQDESMFIADMNSNHKAELQHVARLAQPNVDWSVEELHQVEIVSVSEKGIVLQEVLCSMADARCVALDVPLDWPTGVCPETSGEMKAAFTLLSTRLYGSSGDDVLLPVYEAQQEQLNGAMALMNAEFGKLLKYYALRHAKDALSPTEEVERAHLTQLTFEGLTLKLNTAELASAITGSERLTRRSFDVCILFESPCASAADAEDRLIAMFAQAPSDPDTMDGSSSSFEGRCPDLH